MKRKLIALVTASLLLGSVFVGCGSSSKDSTNKDEKITLTLGCWGSSPAETELLDNQIAAFEEKFPDIHVEKQVITGDYNQTIEANIASGNCPDVYYLDVSLAPTYMDKGAIEPLDKYLDSSDTADFEEGLLSAFQKDGKTYGLPKDYNTLALFYNKKMFEEAGVSVPTTWDELKSAAKALTTEDRTGIVLANDAARFIPFMYQAGGDVFDGTKFIFNSDNSAKGLDFYYSFIKEGYAKTPTDLGEGWNGDALAHEKAAMCIEGGWMIPFMAESAPDVDYGIAMLPKGATNGDLAFTVAYVMNKDTKNKSQSADLIKYLTGTDAQNMTAESGLAIPTRKSMGEVYTTKYPERQALVDMVQYSKVYSFGVDGSKALDAMNKAGEKILFGESDNAKDVLDEAVSGLGK